MAQQDMQDLLKSIKETSRKLDEARLMEVCGTHTVSLFRSGIKSLLPKTVRLISGPGCPVCVTSQGYIDAAIEAANQPDITVCTYGDMVRVPGQKGSLEKQRAQGAEIVVCYSIRDSLRYARTHPGKEVVFLAVGFETTAPATALAVMEAERKGLKNYTILNGHKRIMPALDTLLSKGDVPIDGFLLPGHVSVIIGSEAYRSLVDIYHKACVVAGFEPGQLLNGILHLLEQVANQTPRLENVYDVAVNPSGNVQAQQCLEKVFVASSSPWRAMGNIPHSGFELREPYQRFDACKRFGLEVDTDYDPPGCRCGEVIQGKVDPTACTLFGKTCTHENPIGPCMISSEGTCAAWFRYARLKPS